MTAVLTAVARITDWAEMRRINRDALVARAQLVGATRYHLYRNATDASQVMIVAELPDLDAMVELCREVVDLLGAVVADSDPTEGFWELLDYEGIA